MGRLRPRGLFFYPTKMKDQVDTTDMINYQQGPILHQVDGVLATEIYKVAPNKVKVAMAQCCHEWRKIARTYAHRMFWCFDEALEAGCDASITVFMDDKQPTEKQAYHLLAKCTSPAFFRAFRSKEYAYTHCDASCYIYLSRKGETWLQEMESTTIRASHRKAAIARGEFELCDLYRGIEFAIAIANGHYNSLQSYRGPGRVLGSLSLVSHLFTEEELCAILDSLDDYSQHVSQQEIGRVFQARSAAVSAYISKIARACTDHNRRYGLKSDVISVKCPRVYERMQSAGINVRLCYAEVPTLEVLLSDAMICKDVEGFCKAILYIERKGCMHTSGQPVCIPHALVAAVSNYVARNGAKLVRVFADRYRIRLRR